MEAGGAALPELDAVRGDQVTTPVWRAGYFFVLIFGFEAMVVCFQYFPVWDVLALGRGPGTYAATEGARMIIDIAFLRA